MRRGGHYGKKRLGQILAGIGAAMIVALILPFWFWWLTAGICLLYGGIKLLRR